MTLVVVVAGGPAPKGTDLSRIPPGPDAVVVADSGLDRALELGLTPTVLVGDMDSISSAGQAWAEEHDTPTLRFDPDKDQTDLELALDTACRGADAVVVVVGAGGRLDHSLANLLLIARDAYAGVEMTALVDGATVSAVRDERLLTGEVGSLLTLLAIGGTATGVTVTGVRWPLAGATLEPGSTWGVSNEVTGSAVQVSVEHGVVLAVQPAAETTPSGQDGSHVGT